MAVDLLLNDNTDAQWLSHGKGESLKTRVAAICSDMERRIEQLACGVGYGASARTEQGIPFVAYVNGYEKPEGAMIVPKALVGDMGADAQVKAFQECAQASFETILARKPVDADLLIWREKPQPSRALYPDGLHLHIYTRLAWDKLREDAS